MRSVHEPTSSLVHIIRHGQALHNVDRGYSHRDPPLTDAGLEGAKSISTKMSETPDLIVISPMTRTIQTALTAFPSLVNSNPRHINIQIWPDLREAHDAEFHGSRYDVCEVRSYFFAEAEGDAEEVTRWDVDTQERQDFGPSVLRARLLKTV